MVNKGQIVGIDWNRIVQLHSHVLTHVSSLTASCCHIKASSTYELTRTPLFTFISCCCFLSVSTNINN